MTVGVDVVAEETNEKLRQRKCSCIKSFLLMLKIYPLHMEETQQALNYDRVIHELEINSPKTVSLLRRADPYNLDSNFLFFYSSPFVCLHKPESLENNQCESETVSSAGILLQREEHL